MCFKLCLLTRLNLASTGVDREGFLGSNVAAVAMFVDTKAMEEIESAVRQKVEPPLEAIRTVLQSNLGASLYEAEGKTLEWRNYEQSVKDGLQQLMFHNFLPAEVLIKLIVDGIQ